MSPDGRILERLFAAEFAVAERTLLVGGAAEPLYQPAPGRGDWHRIHYREDFFASALHEVAHWCIAGDRRRQLVDYGYWYAPDGRDDAAQRAFEAAEARPQALEWLFAQAAGAPFRLSVDNLDAKPGARAELRLAGAVAAAARDWRRRGPGGRAGRFLAALRRSFPTGCDVGAMRFEQDMLVQPD